MFAARLNRTGFAAALAAVAALCLTGCQLKHSADAAKPPAAGGAFESADARNAAQAAAQAWAKVPEILARIVPPVFPSREFVITNYSAAGDGVSDCTDAFRQAIDACNRAGGGRVLVPPGRYLSGAIHLKSNVNLHLMKDATILFSTDPEKFLPVVFTRYECLELMNYSAFVYAYGQENIAITGEGTLDGQAPAGPWHQWRSRADTDRLLRMIRDGVPAEQRIFGAGHVLRPNFVQPVRCRNVLIEGILITNSPMWTLHPLYSTNVIVRGVTVGTRGPNTDGCNPDSCRDVLIEDCTFSNGDDCIAVKSGRDHDGRRVNLPCENVVIRNCTFADGHGGVTMGSETSGGIRNVFAERCQFNSTNLNVAMRFKSNPARGGTVENIYLRDCSVQTAQFGIHMTLRYGGNGARDGDAIPVMRNVDIRNSQFENLTRAPIFIEGFSDPIRITDVTIANCEFQSAQRPSTITNAARIHLINNRGLE